MPFQLKTKILTLFGQFNLAVVLSAVIVVAGWSVVHRNDIERDQLNKRRDLRVQYLIDAYRRLESASDRTLSEDSVAKMESAMADIQLFGSPTQVSMTKKLVQTFAETRL